MIILDIETTGTDPRVHSIASIGAVDFSHPERRFYEECRIFPTAHIDPEGLAVNGFTEEQLEDASKKTDGEIVVDFLHWLSESEEQTIAGQNPMVVDVPFLRAVSERYHLNNTFAHRSLDLHSVCFLHMIERGVMPPVDSIKKHTALNSKAIMEYVGIPEEPHPHNALTGALYEAEAFYRLFNGKNLLEEFKKYQLPKGFSLTK